MRNISFALTTEQIRNRSKTVTRRIGWKHLKAGALLCGVVKGMGLKPGEEVERLAIIRVTKVSREPIGDIVYKRTLWDGLNEVRREGFAMQCVEFVQMFCRHMRCEWETEVTRIEFQYVPGGRF